MVKNKLSPPFQQAEFDIMYDEGISAAGEVLDMGVDLGIIDKSGSWYSYGEERIGQGRENAKQFLRDNAETLDEIRAKILERKGIPSRGTSGNGDESDDPGAGVWNGS